MYSYWLASNVVNLYTSKYGVREAVSLKGDTQKGLCNWKFNIEAESNYLYLKNLYTSKYVALQDINCGVREAVSLKSTLKSSTRINCQLFVFILDPSNVVNLYTLKYVALQDINCGVREAVSLKGATQKGLCNWKFNIEIFN